MRVYIAAPWISKQCAKRAADMFEDAGHTITEKWWLHPDSEDPDELGRQAARDWAGVHAARVFVLMNSSKSEGKAVETGMVLQMLPDHDVRIMAVGKPTNVFHYLKWFEWFDSIQEVINALAV